MDIIRAKEIVRNLANGIDPLTGEVFPEDSVYSSPEIIRALFTVLEKVNCDEPSDALRNAGKPWTDEEDAWLREEFYSKRKISDIAKKHGRTRGAIASRLEHLGLKKRRVRP